MIDFSVSQTLLTGIHNKKDRTSIQPISTYINKHKHLKQKLQETIIYIYHMQWFLTFSILFHLSKRLLETH